MLNHIHQLKPTLALLLLIPLTACSNLVCNAQTDEESDPVQQDIEIRRCERQVAETMKENRRKEEQEKEAQLKASMDKYLKQKS